MAGLARTRTRTHIAGRTPGAAPNLSGQRRRKRSFSSLPMEIWHSLGAAIADALDNRRLFLLLPFAVMTGILAYRAARFEPAPQAVIIVALALILWLTWAIRRNSHARLAVLAVFFWFGFALLPLHGALHGTPMLAGSAYGTYRAEVTSVLSSDSAAQRVIIGAIAPVGEAHAIPIRQARLFVRDGPPLTKGMVIEAAMRFAEVPGPYIPGGYDAQFHAYFAGIGSYATATGPPSVLQPAPTSPLNWLDSLRQGIGARLDAGLAEPALGIARALILGDQSHISDATRQTMATAGLAHVLAISGLHLSLVAGGVFAALRAGLAAAPGLSLSLSAKQTAALAGIAAALFYLGLSGASISATRATVTLILVFGAVLAGRRALTMRNVAIAALFVLLIAPQSLFRPGFQLSFAAVAALVGIYEMTRHARLPVQSGPGIRIVRFFATLALTSLVAGAATALFAAYHFQQTAPLGVLGNAMAVPLLAFVVLPAAVLAVLVMPLGFEGVFLGIMGWGIDRILDIATVVAGLSQGWQFTPLLAPVCLLIGMAAIAWFVFFPQPLRFAGPLLALPLILLFGLAKPPDILVSDRTEAIAIRTASGLALVTGRTHSFIVDVWQETYAEEIGQGSAEFSCDPLGCIAQQANGPTVAVVKQLDALAEDCPQTQLVITRMPAPAGCRSITQVIDQSALESGGMHWARWDAANKRYQIQPAITDPDRPWRITRKGS